METLTLTLHKAKTTKNKIVYGTADGSVIQSVYIDRDSLGSVVNLRISVSKRRFPSSPRKREPGIR